MTSPFDPTPAKLALNDAEQSQYEAYLAMGFTHDRASSELESDTAEAKEAAELLAKAVEVIDAATWDSEECPAFDHGAFLNYMADAITDCIDTSGVFAEQGAGIAKLIHAHLGLLREKQAAERAAQRAQKKAAA